MGGGGLARPVLARPLPASVAGEYSPCQAPAARQRRGAHEILPRPAGRPAGTRHNGDYRVNLSSVRIEAQTLLPLARHLITGPRMHLHRKTLDKLAELICGGGQSGSGREYGDPNFVYRSSSSLTAFFRDQCNLNYVYQGETRKW